MNKQNFLITLGIFGIAVVAALFFSYQTEKLDKIENKVAFVLDEMRRGDVILDIREIEILAKEANVNMPRISLTKEALGKILRRGYVSEVKNSIELACRLGDREDVSFNITRAKDYAKKAGCTLADFGITDEIVNCLLQRGYISEVYSNLTSAQKQKDKEDVSFLIKRAEEFAQKAGIPIFGLNLDDQEMGKNLRKKYRDETKKLRKMFKTEDAIDII